MSEVKVDTISERTAAGGVTIDGVLIKDSAVNTDNIAEKTAAAGVTIDGVLVKDGVATFQTASGSPLVFEGATADAFETTFAITDPTADRTITFPDSSFTVPSTGGKILQVVTDTALTTNNTTSGTFDSTVSGLACLITPASSSNKILVMGSVYLFSSDDEMATAVSLYKNASDFTETYDLLTSVSPIVSSGEGWGGSYRLGAAAGADGGYVAGLNYLDTANTTNQITYSISGRVAGGSGTVTMGTIRSTTVLVAMEISV